MFETCGGLRVRATRRGGNRRYVRTQAADHRRLSLRYFRVEVRASTCRCTGGTPRHDDARSRVQAPITRITEPAYLNVTVWTTTPACEHIAASPLTFRGSAPRTSECTATAAVAGLAACSCDGRARFAAFMAQQIATPRRRQRDVAQPSAVTSSAVTRSHHVGAARSGCIVRAVPPLDRPGSAHPLPGSAGANAVRSGRRLPYRSVFRRSKGTAVVRCAPESAAPLSRSWSSFLRHFASP